MLSAQHKLPGEYPTEKIVKNMSLPELSVLDSRHAFLGVTWIHVVVN